MKKYKLGEGKKYGERGSYYYRAVNKGLIVKVILDQRPELGEGATLVDFSEKQVKETPKT